MHLPFSHLQSAHMFANGEVFLMVFIACEFKASSIAMGAQIYVVLENVKYEYIASICQHSPKCWIIFSGKSLSILSDHKGFVQGVAWDPLGQYIATLCSDR